MKILRKFIILVISLVLSFFSAIFFANIYKSLFKDYGSYVDVRFLIGLPLSYTFFLTLLFTAFGGAKKYWWIGLGLLPALAFELYFDLEHIYFPIALGLVGWLIGLGLRKMRAAFGR